MLDERQHVLAHVDFVALRGGGAAKADTYVATIAVARRKPCARTRHRLLLRRRERLARDTQFDSIERNAHLTGAAREPCSAAGDRRHVSILAAALLRSDPPHDRSQ